MAKIKAKITVKLMDDGAYHIDWKPNIMPDNTTCEVLVAVMKSYEELIDSATGDEVLPGTELIWRPA